VGGGEEDFSFTVYLVWGHSCFSLWSPNQLEQKVLFTGWAPLWLSFQRAGLNNHQWLSVCRPGSMGSAIAAIKLLPPAESENPRLDTHHTRSSQLVRIWQEHSQAVSAFHISPACKHSALVGQVGHWAMIDPVFPRWVILCPSTLTGLYSYMFFVLLSQFGMQRAWCCCLCLFSVALLTLPTQVDWCKWI
jgi:hypothetical protein